MHIIPVIDLKEGRAVHAVRGERARYAPVQSSLAQDGDALALALAYRDQFGCATCYVADLDAIGAGNGNGNLTLLAALAALGLALWVDAGVSGSVEAWALAQHGAARVIVGSESLASTGQLGALAAGFPPERLVLSVDLSGDRLLGPRDVAAHDLVGQAVAAGIGTLILLDLKRVGSGEGPPLAQLVALRRTFPALACYVGGGVRGRDDLDALVQAGAVGALVATALHRGLLRASDIQAYSP